ncbi:hypothetical protein WJX72_004504 [[Myrmecia] bisecta]|uniref:ABC transporter domain-containing protein n=1 Tax=[Myrmecia] bisecta TaxID=41462 RepID=A0AAW1PLL3_9CHLO
MRNWTPPSLPGSSSSPSPNPAGSQVFPGDQSGFPSPHHNRFESNQSSRLGSFMAEDPKFDSEAASSSGSSEAEADVEQQALVSVVWKELSLVAKGRWGHKGETVLLKGVKGFAEPRSVLAVVGPPDSGCSILLAALARRVRRPVAVFGTILINGIDQNHSLIQPTYCTQHDELPSHLTVEQVLVYTARLQIPGQSAHEMAAMVHKIGQQMGLLTELDKLTHLLPVGTRRRVAIACQLINCTPLLILHDVLVGINEGDALAILRTVHEHCRDGCTAIIAVQQPTTDMCSFFGKAYVLCAGELVFFGNTNQEARDLLSAAGMPCPPLYSPVEQYMRLLDPSFEVYLQVAQGEPDAWNARFSNMMFKVLQTTYTTSMVSKRLATRTLDMAAEHTDPQLQEYATERRSVWGQTAVLAARWLAQGMHCTSLYAGRLLAAVVIALAYGATYSQLSHTASGTEDRLVVLFIAAGVLPLLALAALQIYSNSTKVFARERQGAGISVAAHMLAKTCLDLPLLFVVAVLSAVVLIPLASLNTSSSAWGYFILAVWLSLLAADAMVRAVTACFSNEAWQRAVLLVLFGVQLLSCGYFAGAGRGINLVVGTVAFPAWAFKGLVYNEFYGSSQRWGCVGQGVRTSPGVQCNQLGQQVWQHLSQEYGVTPASKWHSVWVLLALYAAWVLIHVIGLVIRARCARGRPVQPARPRAALAALKTESSSSLPVRKEEPRTEMV